jgi:hypothetical protein
MNILPRALLQNRSVRGLAVVFTLLLFTACTTNFFYERIDWFVVWRVNKYIPLDSEQKASLKADVGQRLEEMRGIELPRVAALLQQTAIDINSGYVTAEMIDARYHEMLAEFDQFMLGIVPISMRLLRSLDEDQVAELFANFEDANKEMYEDYSGRTAEEREKNRNKSAIKSTEQWTGRLDSEQKLLVKAALAEMDDASEQWIEYQRQWQQRFRTLIETRPPEAEYRQELTQLFVYPRESHSDVYRAKVEANRAILNNMLAELLTNLSDKQRKRMVGELNGYADDMTKLSQVR